MTSKKKSAFLIIRGGIVGLSIAYQLIVRKISIFSKLYLLSKGGFKRYVYEQALLSLPSLYFQSAKELNPLFKKKDIEKSNKVGISSQLLDIKNERLVDDFLCLDGPFSTHLLNSISPALQQVLNSLTMF